MVHQRSLMTPGQILRRLHTGNRWYLSKGTRHRSKKAPFRSEPQPIAAVVTCPDAVISVEEIFALVPGELIVIQAANYKLGQAGIARLVSAERLYGVTLVVVLVHSSGKGVHERHERDIDQGGARSGMPTSAEWRIDPLYHPRLQALNARCSLIDAMPKLSKMIVCAAVLDERNRRVHFVSLEPQN